MQTASPALGPSMDRTAGSHSGMSLVVQVGWSLLGPLKGLPRPCPSQAKCPCKNTGPQPWASSCFHLD